jgi:hypothetical protein
VTRLWTSILDAVDVFMSLPLAILLLLVAAILIGVLLYFYPRWIPRRWPRFRGFKLRWPRFRKPNWRGWWRWRRRKKGTEHSADDADPETVEEDEEQLPDVPAEVFVSLADRLAAQGRFAEAIRERLRGIVRGLVESGVIEHRPGWTVTELAAAAAAARVEVDPPLREAVRIFSDIWYGQQPADGAQDERMRTLAADVIAAVRGRQPVGAAA